MKIGLFGGTFNPIHVGHLIIAEWIRDELEIDTVYFIPTAIPPHKSNSDIIEAKHRYEMVKSAINNHDKFEVSDFEMKSTQSYSIDTINFFKNKFRLPDKNIFFIIGEDNLAQLDKWCSPEKIIQACSLIVVPRNFEKFKEKLKKNKNKYKDYFIIKFPYLDISSTMIRERIKIGKSIKYLVPDSVEDYIIKEGLYI